MAASCRLSPVPSPLPRLLPSLDAHKSDVEHPCATSTSLHLPKPPPPKLPPTSMAPPPSSPPPPP
jgi:hypothetical protein